MSLSVGHGLADLSPEVNDIGQEDPFVGFDDVVRPPTPVPGFSAIDDASGKVFVPNLVGYRMVVGFSKVLLSSCEVVHCAARTVMKRDEMAMRPVEVFDTQFHLVESRDLGFTAGCCLIGTVRYHVYV